jgi:hypothetical protein
MRLLSFFAASVLALSSFVAHADTLIGSSVMGSLSTPIPALVGLGAPFSGPVTVTAGSEFHGVVSTGPGDETFVVSANFSDSTLLISVSSADSGSFIYTQLNLDLVTLTFTDSAFTGPFSLTSYLCVSNPSCGFAASGLGTNTFQDSTLTIGLNNLFAGQTYLFTETVAPTAITPEPSSIGLLATGMLGIAGMVRRKFAV